MVNNFFKLINREISGLHEAAYLLGIFAFLSQILALVRDRLLAHFFGAGEILDVYYAAFRIPDFIFVAIASTVSISVLIPFLIERLGQERRGSDFINTIFSFFFIFISAISVVVFFLVPSINSFIFSGFSEAQIEEVSLLTRILLLSPILLGLSNLFASIVQINKKFIIYAISPLLYNIGIIFGILIFYPVFGVKGLALGVILGALIHLLAQAPSVVKSGIVPKLTLKISWPDVKKVVMLSLPRTITLSSNHLALIFLLGFASITGVGAVSIFNFSFNLQSVPLSIIGVSYSVAAFPTLARLFSEGERDKFLEQITVAARHIIFWSIPILILFIVLRAQIVRTILGSGEFDWSDTRLTAAALAMFAFSVTAQSLILLFVRGYYAAGNTMRPLLVNIFSSISIVAFAYAFYNRFTHFDTFRYFLESLFRVEGIEGTSVLVFPLSYSIGVILNAILLWILFQKDFKRFSSSVSKTFWHSLSAGIIMGFAAYQSLGVFNRIFDINTFWGIFLQGLLSGAVGVAVGIVILRLLGNEEMKEVWETMHHKFWKTKAIIPDQRSM